MKDNNLPKFEDSDAFLFLEAMRAGGDTQLVRHFCKSMRDWNKTLLNAIDKQRGSEREQYGQYKS